MNNFNKFILTLLTFSLFSLNSMFEDNGQKQEPVDVVNTQNQKNDPLKLKTLVAIKIIELINSNKLSENELAKLPEDLKLLIKIFQIPYTYGDNIIEGRQKDNPIIQKLVDEFTISFYKLLDSDSQNSTIFQTALDHFFATYIDCTGKRYMLTNGDNCEHIFLILNLILNIILNPKNKLEQINTFNDTFYKGQLSITGAPLNIIDSLFHNSIHWNLTTVLKLLLNLDLFTKEKLLKILIESYSRCSHDILEIFTEKLALSKNELEDEAKLFFCRGFVY